MAEVILTDDNFETEVTNFKGIFLVDFWAPWCGPCRMQGPIVEEIAKEIEGKAGVGKLNVDENQKIAEKFNIMSLPTIVIFRDGKVAETLTGMQPKESLLEIIDKHLQ